MLIEFKDEDIVRNSLVSKIVSKYENFEKIEGIGKKYFSNKINENWNKIYRHKRKP